MANKPEKTLETFPNLFRERDYHIHMEIPEFTCLCPKTGQPDFATLILTIFRIKNVLNLKALNFMYGHTGIRAYFMKRLRTKFSMTSLLL